ncbi:hypothetical protein BT63DRAFT_411786 [Microthyrium microscopicum]|uniref:Cytokinesis regulator n=1 Tax=Microthyrium microscopicum TaxID=703497 RepID=A0A6A6ULZ0_9PEZI|nr:hypothetical protein BT63DRAFT_411786 [Microthyrium microscopicum]
MENWDDDLDFQGDMFANSSAHTNVSSRVSVRSESIAGEDDWQVNLATDDTTNNAISAANKVGFNIPQNVPSSALLGGTIKRLGKKKSRPNVADDWGDDFDIPMGGTEGLKLRPKMSTESALAPNTPATTEMEDFDSEWAEGSLGIRNAGSRRDNRGRSSSVSALSGSCITMESEEDDFGGLELPTEPIDFNSRLKKRQASEYDPPTSVPQHPGQPTASHVKRDSVNRLSHQNEEDDMMAGLDFGENELIDPKRRKINRNVKIAQTKPSSSPAIRSGTTLTFTDKPGSSKIPRPATLTKNHKLDPVPESSNSPAAPQRNVSRFNRLPPTTTSAQLLRSKRSAPVLGSRNTPTASRPPVPFLPAGTTASHSHHVSNKSANFHFRQPSDSHDRPHSPTTRPYSRISGAQNPADSTPSRTGFRKDATAASLLRQAANQRTLNVPKRRAFGDGSELDRFDDLPTSATKESKFVKEPSNNRVQPKTLRNTTSRRNLITHDNSSTPVPPSNSSATSTVPTTPLAPPTPRSYFPRDNTPRFARDTAASRNAREQRLGGPANRPRFGGPLETVTNVINWKAQVAARSPQTSPSTLRHRKKGEARQPVLIKNMGPASTKNEKGMVYNPDLQRWEGNEHALTTFENPSTSTLPLHPTHKDNHSRHHHTSSIPSMLPLAPRDQNIPRHGSPPRPALISQISQVRGVVVERGMVFDPQRMTWLKIDSRTLANDPLRINTGLGTPSISVEEEDDPFATIEDLVDEKTAKITPGAGGINSAASDKENVDWVVGEEFDLGPAFVRRQRAEEAEWRRRVERWSIPRDNLGDEWRWEIRRVAEQYEALR